MSFHDLYLHHCWAWQVERKLVANIVLGIGFFLLIGLFLHGDCLICIGESQECGRLHIVPRNQRFSFQNVYPAIVLLWLEQFSVVFLLFLCDFSAFRHDNHLDVSCTLLLLRMEDRIFYLLPTKQGDGLDLGAFEV